MFIAQFVKPLSKSYTSNFDGLGARTVLKIKKINLFVFEKQSHFTHVIKSIFQGLLTNVIFRSVTTFRQRAHVNLARMGIIIHFAYCHALPSLQLVLAVYCTVYNNLVQQQHQRKKSYRDRLQPMKFSTACSIVYKSCKRPTSKHLYSGIFNDPLDTKHKIFKNRQNSLMLCIMFKIGVFL